MKKHRQFNSLDRSLEIISDFFFSARNLASSVLTPLFIYLFIRLVFC